jgi:8-amino-7-oxononanoate synthase
MSNAKSYKFKHNDLEDLVCHLERSREVSGENEIYVITESVFSMDGDTPDLNRLIQLSKSYNVHLIIDEAHAMGVFRQGLVSESIFARVITFGKALGCHGAAVLGSKDLMDYLINFSRPLIYTTALSPHELATIKFSYEALENTKNVEELHQNILFFNKEIERLKLSDAFIKSTSAIHCCIISGNDKVKQLSLQLKDKGFDVKPILSPTVPKEKERLRLCLHNYNSREEISEVLSLIATFVNS